MDTIPTEIVREIFRYVPQKDLASVRLVSRFFSNAASDRYFRTIRISVTEAAIEKLRCVACRPELAQYVRCLVYPYQLLEQDLRDNGSLRDAYEEGFRKQKELEGSGELAKALEFAFSKMVNIREVSTELFRNASSLDEWPENAIIGDTDHERLCNIYRMFPDPQSREIPLLRAVKELMIAAASQEHTRLDKLSINSIWRGIFREDSEIFWNSAQRLFQNLTSLSIYFATDASNSDIKALHDDANEDRIFKFLSLAPKLRKLALGLDWQARELHEDVLPLLKIFGESYVWKNLETFLFNGRPMKGEELMHFLARHAATLKTFGLYIPRLRTGTWRDVLDFIKEHPRLCLEQLILLFPSEELADGRFRRYGPGDDSDRMNDYVLRNGPPFPFTDAELEERGLQRYYDGENLSRDESYEEDVSGNELDEEEDFLDQFIADSFDYYGFELDNEMEYGWYSP
ncbi:hypothetical protein RUND412_007000 [Rhizina undulata]